MKKSLFILFYSVCFIFLVVSSVYYVFQDSAKGNTSLIASENHERDVKTKSIFINAEELYHNKKKVYTATLAGVGDILIHDSVYKDAYKDGSYDFKPMFENVRSYLRQADITFANQETMLGGVELGLSGYPQFNSPIEVGDALIDAGVDIVSMANNHTLDAGETGILNAINYYNSVGMSYTGAFESDEDRLDIRTIERNGIVFSFLAYTYGTNGLPVPNGKDYLVNLIDENRIKQEIESAKEISDVVVLSLHLGNEYQTFPNEQQKTLVKEFTNAGADIILGHHPHVLQPMEWVEGEDGHRAFVAYSLGNFISGQQGINREIGGILQLEVQKTVEGENVAIQIQDPRFVPVFTYKNNWREYKLHVLEGIGNDILANGVTHYETTKEHVSTWMPELSFSIPEEK